MSYGLSYGNVDQKSAKTYDFAGIAHTAGGSYPRKIGTEYARPINGGQGGESSYSSQSMRAAQKRPASVKNGAERTGSARRTASRSVGGEARRPTASRAPKMSNSAARNRKTAATNAVPVAGVHIEPTIKTVTDKKKKPLNIPAFIAGGLCTALFMYMLTNFVMINEYTKSITALRNELSELSEQERKLSLQLEKRNDLRIIEEKAKEIGMVKVDQVSKQYVILDSEDKIEILDDSQ